MKEISQLIGQNLRSIRKKQNLSLDEVSACTGVSKPMLGQIERGKSNPTVSTLWKIATGLKVPFSVFMEQPDITYKVMSYEDLSPIKECDGLMNIYPMFPFDIKNNFEILYITLEPKCIHQSPKHDIGVEEYIFIIEGVLHISLGEEEIVLKQGQALKFLANTIHIYSNKEDIRCLFQNLIVYHH
jgi:transcriptional regulator with XRE-family HTH domain